MWHARAVDDELLAALGTISTQAQTATESTAKVVNQFLDHVVTFPCDRMFHRKSGIQLAAHSDAGHLNENKVRSRASSYACSSEDVPMSTFKGTVLAIAQIIKFLMPSTKAELTSLFTTAKNTVEIRQTLEKMGWPQAHTQAQARRTIALGLVTSNIVPQKSKKHRHNATVVAV